MPDPALTSLLARVEAVTGADLGLSRDVWKAIAPELLARADRSLLGAEDLTSSCDAVLALIERELPGAWWRIDRKSACWATCGPSGEQEDGWGATPALALLAAFIRAKIAQTEEAHA